MAKIRINGETFDFDATKKPMSEALALEAALGMRYAEWESELQAGSMKAMCGFVWLVWRRDGRDVEMKDLLSGEVEVELTELLESLVEAGRERAGEQEPQDPTSGAITAASAPDGAPTSATPTSASSPRSSASRPRRSMN